MTEKTFPPDLELEIYRRGWADGAAFHGVQSSEATYLRAYKHGRNAFTAAMLAERARLSLPPEAPACDGCALGLHPRGNGG